MVLVTQNAFAVVLMGLALTTSAVAAAEMADSLLHPSVRFGILETIHRLLVSLSFIWSACKDHSPAANIERLDMAKRKKVLDKEKDQIMEEFRNGQYNICSLSHKYDLALSAVRKLFKQFLFAEVRMYNYAPRMSKRMSA